MHDPVYVGIGVCSHNKDVLETAVFSNVSLTAAAAEAAQPVLYSTVETVPVSGDRRVVSVAPGRVTASQRMPDGALPEQAPGGKYVYRHSDRSGTFQIWRTLADGREPEQVTTDSLQNVFPCLSPDGQLLAFLSFAGGAPRIPEDQDVMLRVLSLKDNKIRVLAKLVGGKGTLDAPCWSADSRRLSFVSYQMVPLTLLQGR
jgi:hypothetical protein